MEGVPRIVHTFDWPDRFVVGTVGPPGSRTFYLQARSGSRTVSVALEKEQSAALAAKIDDVLDDLMALEGNPASIPAQASEALVDEDALDQPVEEQFRVGMISLGWDRSTTQLVVEAVPVETVDPETLEPVGSQPEESLVVRIPVGTARAFAERTRRVVAAGRPPCPLCGEPVDPEGHTCDLDLDRP